MFLLFYSWSMKKYFKVWLALSQGRRFESRLWPEHFSLKNQFNINIGEIFRLRGLHDSPHWPQYRYIVIVDVDVVVKADGNSNNISRKSIDGIVFENLEFKGLLSTKIFALTYFEKFLEGSGCCCCCCCCCWWCWFHQATVPVTDHTVSNLHRYVTKLSKDFWNPFDCCSKRCETSKRSCHAWKNEWISATPCCMK